MGNYDELKQAVSDVIKTNGNQEITGQVLQNTLLSINLIVVKIIIEISVKISFVFYYIATSDFFNNGCAFKFAFN
jgi:hypothetical protein